MVFWGIANRIEINSSGLECCVNFDFGSKVGYLNCYMVLAKICEPYSSVNEVSLYVEDDETIILKVEDKKEVKLSVVFGINCFKTDVDTQEHVIQSIDKSSHAKFVATVMEMVDEYTIICSIDKLGERILVYFEEIIEHLEKGDRIEFTGEIKAALSKP